MLESLFTIFLRFLENLFFFWGGGSTIYVFYVFMFMRLCVCMDGCLGAWVHRCMPLCRYVCMCVCMYVRMCLRVYVCMYLCIDVSSYLLCTSVSPYLLIYTSMSQCTCVSTYLRIYASRYACMCVCMRLCRCMTLYVVHVYIYINEVFQIRQMFSYKL